MFFLVVIISILLFNIYFSVDYGLSVALLVAGDGSFESRAFVHVSEGSEVAVHLFYDGPAPARAYVDVGGRVFPVDLVPGSRASLGPFIVDGTGFLWVGVRVDGAEGVGRVSATVAVSGGSRAPYTLAYAIVVGFGSLMLLGVFYRMLVDRGLWVGLYPSLVLAWFTSLVVALSAVRDFLEPAYAVVYPSGDLCPLDQSFVFLGAILDRLLESGVLVLALFVGALSAPLDSSFRFHYYYSMSSGYSIGRLLARVVVAYLALAAGLALMVFAVLAAARVPQALALVGESMDLVNVAPVAASLLASLAVATLVSGLAVLVSGRPQAAPVSLVAVSYMVPGSTLYAAYYQGCVDVLEVIVSPLGWLYAVLLVVLVVLAGYRWARR